VSREGRHDPIWSRGGDELFYREGTKLMTAVIAAKQPDLQFKLPRLLFEGGFIPCRGYSLPLAGRPVL